MFDPGKVKKGIEKVKDNIAVLEDSIAQERKRIREYESWLDLPNCGGFDRQSIENGVEQLKVNIVTIETAIEGEYQRISELRNINDTLERKHMEAEIAKQEIIIKH